MDASRLKALADLCDDLTTTGDPQLDQKKLKELKKICRLSDEYVSQCFEHLWSQLKRNHSEIRLSTFQVIDELFRRSHKFRTLLLDNFQSYLELTLEIDLDVPLPPPKTAAESLKNSAYQALRKWHEAYSTGYRKLDLAFNYLRNCHQVDFNKADHMSALQRQREQDAQLKLENQRKRIIGKVEAEVDDREADIYGFAVQLSTCFKLLIPSQDVFDVFDNDIFSSKNNSSAAGDTKGEELCRSEQPGADNTQQCIDNEKDHQGLDMQQHGVLNRQSNIQINLKKDSTVEESEDNTDIIHNLDELKVLLTMRYMPMIVKWMAVLQRNGANQALITRLIDLKQAVIKSLTDLDMLTIHRIGQEDDDDDDLVEVPEEVDEVKFFKSRLGMTGKPSEVNASTSKDLKSQAPVLEYDLDLEYWENPEELTVPETLPNESSRFWIAEPQDGVVAHSSLQEMYSARKIEFAGKFVPVKWTCRALLGSGRLCPRMDRVKCPFHGLIIARKDDGSPANFADAEKLARIKAKQRQEKPEWQDPSLLKEIEAATGINLKVQKPRGKASKSRLTNINKVNNTSRARLESKVLSRGAIKRVAGAMNMLDNKKFKDKFCHSFVATHANK